MKHEINYPHARIKDVNFSSDITTDGNAENPIYTIKGEVIIESNNLRMAKDYAAYVIKLLENGVMRF